jgi:tetratricopeptide (TPR) repeat protein
MTAADRERLREALRLNARASNLADNSQFQEALPLVQQAVESTKQVLGADDPEYLTCLANLGWIYRDGGSLDKAEPVLREVLAKREMVLGPDHPDVGLSNNALGWFCIQRKQFAEAEKLFRRAADIYRTAAGPARGKRKGLTTRSA